MFGSFDESGAVICTKTISRSNGQIYSTLVAFDNRYKKKKKFVAVVNTRLSLRIDNKLTVMIQCVYFGSKTRV
jgi:hypothetical protein